MISTQTRLKVSLDEVRALSRYEASYYFFDREVIIKTNLREALDGFQKIYWRFQTRPADDSPRPFELYIIELKSESRQICIICGEDYQVLENAAVTPNLYLFVFSYIIPRVTSHFLIHAATLSYNSQAAIVAAHSTSGKTTLAVELIKRGIGFLSDELAPLNRKTHWVDPFTRSIGLRTLSVHGLDSLAESLASRAPNAKGEIKWMIDPEDLRENSAAQSCPPRNVIFLEPQYDEREAQDKLQILEATLTRVSEGLVRAVRRIAGIVDHELVDDRIFPLLRLTVEKDAAVLQEIEECTKVYDSALVSVVHGKTRKPDFSLDPVLKPMAKFEGTFELAKMMLNGHSEAALMEEFNHSPALMLTHLADITKDLHFHRLVVGRLDRMADIAESLIKGSHDGSASR